MTVGSAGRYGRSVLAVFAALVFAAGCELVFQETVRGSGDIETREIALGDVTEVHVASSLDAEILPGEEPRVTVEADDNVQDRIEVVERGRQVTIRLARAVRLRDATVGITVALPAVTEIRASGSSGIAVAEGLNAEDLRVTASGSSDLAGTVDVARLEVTASGSSDVALAGSTRALTVNASGSSDADLRELVVEGDAAVEASGSSDVDLHVRGALRARASGASDVRYAGNPTEVDAEESGASSVSARD